MSDSPGIFRQEALDAQRITDRPGAPLLLPPHWVGRSMWLILSLVSVALTFALGASVGEYAEGPAVVRIEGRLDLTSEQGGVIQSVEVEPGQTVKKGQLLVRFRATTEQQALEHARREFELQLTRLLVNPADETARQSLTSLRAARDLAEARLQERSLVAPRDGVVANARIRPGQALAPGEVVVTLVDENSAVHSLVAFVPGQFRPMLRRGMKLRFALDGFPYTYAITAIDSVGDEVVGPNELRRYLGRELGDTLNVTGGYVLVRARLSRPTFTFQDRPYRYYDGVPGRIDLRVRSTRLFWMLFPAARGLIADAV